MKDTGRSTGYQIRPRYLQPRDLEVAINLGRTSKLTKLTSLVTIQRIELQDKSMVHLDFYDILEVSRRAHSTGV